MAFVRVCARVLRRASVVSVALVLVACGGGGGGGSAGNAPPAPTAVEIVPGAVLLTGASQTALLRARTLDGNGRDIGAPVTYTSSDPSQITVAPDGTVRAVAAVGSAVIRATSGTARSNPVLVTVAQPAGATTLLRDAQILSHPALVSGTGADLGDRFTLTAAIASPPAAGTLLLAAESAPVAGRVVFAAPVASGYEIVYEMVALDELFQELLVSAEFGPDERLTATSASGERRPATQLARPLATLVKKQFGLFECSLDYDPALLDVSLTPNVNTRLAKVVKAEVRRLSIQHLLVQVNGSVEASLTGQVSLFNVTGTAQCDSTAASVPLPALGPLTPYLSPDIRLAVRYKVEAAGSSSVVIGAGADVKADVTLGIKYDTGVGFTNINSIDGSASVAVTRTLPNTAARVEFKSFAGLVGGLGLEIPLLGLKSPNALEVTAGRQETTSWGATFDAANDPLFTPADEVDLAFGIGPGEDLAKLIKRLSRGLPALSVDLSATRTYTLGTSPLMTSGTVNRASFRAGDALGFSIKLDPTSVRWGLVPAYNVDEVRIYRIDYATQSATLVASARAADGQSDFTATWTATSAGNVTDAGRSTFFAFVVPRQALLLRQQFPVELGAISAASFEVRPASTTVAAGASLQFDGFVDGVKATSGVTWSATGGTISSTGLFAAGSTGGVFQVTATQTATGATASAQVTVTAPVSTPVVGSVTTTPTQMVAGSPATFSIIGTNLPVGLVLSFPGCAASEVASTSTTLRQFTCTPSTIGTNLAGTVAIGTGANLFSFTATVVAPGPVNQPPKASMSVSSTTPAAGQVVVFDPANSVDVDGAIARLDWSFGDGQSAASTGPSLAPVSHSYTAAGTYTATLTVTDDKGATATTSQVIVVGGSATNGPLGLAMTAAPDPVRPGELVQYAVTLVNRSALSGFFSIDVIVPNNTTVPTTAIGQGGFCVGTATGAGTACPSGGIVRWQNVPLNAGQMIAFAFAALVDAVSPPADGTVLHATATATSGAGVSQNAAVDAVVSSAGPTLAMVALQSPVAPGGTLTYVLDFANPEAAPTAPATLVVPLPAGLTFAGASDGGTFVGGVVTWDIGALPAGAIGQRRLRVTADAQAGSGAVVIASAELRQTTTGRSLARGRATAVALSAPGTQLALTGAPDAGGQGKHVHYIATVVNRSGLSAFYTIDVLVPNHTSVAPGTIGQGGFCVGQPATQACPAGNVVRWQNFPLNAGQALSVQFAATVDTAATTPLPMARTTATASSSASGASAAIDVAPAAGDVALGIANTASPASAGNKFSYTLQFGNRGGLSTPPASLSLWLPAGTTVVSASDGGAVNGSLVQWDVGAMTAGAFGQRSVVFTVDPATAPGTLLTVVADLRDAATARSLARANTATPVLADAGTVLSLTATSNAVGPGESIQYVLAVVNRGALSAFYTIEAQVPDYTVVPLGSIGHGGVCVGGGVGGAAAVCPAGGTLRWPNFPVNGGQQLAVSFAARVDASAAPAEGTLIRASATALSSSSGASAVADVGIGAAGLALRLGTASNTVAPGGTVTFVLDVANPGATSTGALTLAMPLPPATSLVLASDGGVPVDGGVQWNLSPVPAGGAVFRLLTLAVDAGAASGSVIGTAADVRDSSTGQSLARAVAAPVVLGAPGTQLTLNAGTEAVRPGQHVHYAVAVTNTSALSAFYTIYAQVPDHTSVPLTSIGQGGVCVLASASPTCPGGASIRWSNLPLNAGQSIVVPFAAQVDSAGAPTDGTLLRSTASALSSSSGATASAAVRVSSTDFALGVGMGLAPTPGGLLSYTLRFGNPGAVAPVATLLLALPPGAALVSASDAGAELGGFVRWDLGTVGPGAAGLRQAVIRIDAAAVNGVVVPGFVELRENGSGRSLARGNAMATVLGNAGTQVALAPISDPVARGQTVAYTASVTNRGGLSAFYTVDVHVPNGTVVPTVSTGQSGFCVGVATTPTSVCPAGGILRWQNVPISAGQTGSFSFSATIAGAGLPGGTVIRGSASAVSSSSGAAATADVAIAP